MEMEKVEHTIQHLFHPQHPLVLVEEQSNQNEKASCWGCGEVVSGSSFTCLHCNYHLHKECAQAPFEILDHPLHPQHSYLLLQERKSTYLSGYACALCKEKHDMFFYECPFSDCYFALDIKCALSSHKLDKSITYEFKDDDRQYPFIFFENHKDELKNVYCSWCHESLTDSIYFGVGYNFHKKCFNELPAEIIDHPCHHLHTLVLHFDKSQCFCEVCQKEDEHNFFYHCFACKFYIHVKCIWPRPIIENKRYHEHPFVLFFKNDSFICDACGTNGKFVSYICLTCHLQVHKNCTSLPRIIKAARHNHAIFHKYFLKNGELEKYDCKICFDEVKAWHGNYRCLRKDCNYIVHVKCATEDENLYYVIDQDEELHETNEATDSSIAFRVIKKNKQGEAIEIEHFNHEHILVFEDKTKEDKYRNCDGCMQSISTPFYSCSGCNFFLHKTCAELPKIKHHWIDRFAATLEAANWLLCRLCNRWCSGLLYSSRTLDFCLRCALVPSIIEGQRHEHFLFFDYKCMEQCKSCGVGSGHGAFRCKKCPNFALDFACMTLPEAIQHRCDNHLLKLTYHDENDEHYCDICEEDRDPNHWYYSCSTCDNSFHPKCVLGKYPFVKEGMTWPYFRHPHSHDVSFVRKVDGYPECSVCGELCQDEALKCPTCNYIAHGKCGSLNSGSSDLGWFPFSTNAKICSTGRRNEGMGVFVKEFINL